MLLLLLACQPTPADTAAPKAESQCDTPLSASSEVSLPADDAPHSELVEWWYWTGHLQDASQRWYGFEHVFFLFEVGTDHHLMAHSALSDIDAGTFSYDVAYQTGYSVEATTGFDFSLETYAATGYDGADHLSSALPDGAGFVLDLQDAERPVYQHGDGYTDYDFGGYTWYYSRPRMDVSGAITTLDGSQSVTGQAWFDHQWGNLLIATSTGWDWFAIQLDDGREIMLFLVRPNGATSLLGGTITDENCVSTEFGPEDFTLTPLDEWTSPTSGCTWPQGWDLTIGDLSLHIEPVMANQEIYSEQKTYWEGAATVSGDATGRAYVELTEYCE